MLELKNKVVVTTGGLRIILILLFIPFAFAANPIKKSDQSPVIDEPVIPGSQVPLESMNTAPTDPALEDDSAKRRFITEKDLKKQKTNTPVKKQSQQDKP